MTAYSAVPTTHGRRLGSSATTRPSVPAAGAEHDTGMLRGIGFGLAFVAPFWGAVAVVLVRVL